MSCREAVKWHARASFLVATVAERELSAGGIEALRLARIASSGWRAAAKDLEGQESAQEIRTQAQAKAEAITTQLAALERDHAKQLALKYAPWIGLGCLAVGGAVFLWSRNRK